MSASKGFGKEGIAIAHIADLSDAHSQCRSHNKIWERNARLNGDPGTRLVSTFLMIGKSGNWNRSDAAEIRLSQWQVYDQETLYR